MEQVGGAQYDNSLGDGFDEGYPVLLILLLAVIVLFIITTYVPDVVISNISICGE